MVLALNHATLKDAVAELVHDGGILRPGPATKELVLVQIHPGIDVAEVRAAAGWELEAASELATTPVPAATEVAALRELQTSRMPASV